MSRWPVWLRAPVLGAGLGLVAGGFEAIKLGATLRLYLDFGQALLLGVVAVALGGLLGAVIAAPVGVFVALLARRWELYSRHAAGMALTTGALACWFLLPVARLKFNQGLPLPAMAFVLAPIGMAGVLWFNAQYWLRREDLGVRQRVGWTGWSTLFALALALIGALWISGRSYGSARALDTDPGVIIVTIDTLRRDHVSVYHTDDDSPAQTPVIDALADQGVLFTDAITPFPETLPSHSALFTGRHPVRNGVLSNGHVLARGFQTLAEVLQGEGYATGAFVSSIAVAERTGLGQGFEVYDDDFIPWVSGASQLLVVRYAVALIMRFGDPTDFPFLLERPAPITSQRALSWLAQNRDRPFLLWVHFFEPHSPYEPHGLPGFEDNGTPDAPSVDHRWILSHEAEFTYTDEVRHKLRRLYAEEVAYTDQQLGLFLQQIEALDMGRPLDIVVVADHGEMLGEHGVEFNHHGIWDQTVRVPLIIKPHELPTYKRVVDAQVRMMDVPATILASIKLDPMDDSEGGDLMRFAQGVFDKGWASLVLGRKTASLSEGTLLGFRAPNADGSGDVKLIIDTDSDRAQLYDLVKDPGETHDIAPKQAAAVESLRARVLSEAGDVSRLSKGAPVDRGVQEGLKALGYME